MRKIQNGLVEIPLTAKCLLLFLASVCLLCWGSYQYGKHAAAGNDNYSEGIQQAGEQLERAERDQQETSAVIGEVADRVGDIQQRADRAETAAERARQSLSELDGENKRAGEIVEECERMLESCGRRIQKGTEKN